VEGEREGLPSLLLHDSLCGSPPKPPACARLRWRSARRRTDHGSC